MNEALSDFTLNGMVADIGGGRSPDYFDFFKKGDSFSVSAVDASLGTIDFENDRLPFRDGSVDTVICCNVLEHIYNHSFLVSEMNRILKEGGHAIGFVPFFIQYHPDPHDYFRYTHEALIKIFAHAGFKDVSIRAIGNGPFTVNFNNIMLSFPRMLRVIGLYPTLLADRIFLSLRPGGRERYPLGYVFSMRK
jgi:SAM-dependent methyltransferase